MLPALALGARRRRSAAAAPAGRLGEAVGAEELLVALAEGGDVGVGLRPVEHELGLQELHPLADVGAHRGGRGERGVQGVDRLHGRGGPGRGGPRRAATRGRSRRSG